MDSEDASSSGKGSVEGNRYVGKGPGPVAAGKHTEFTLTHELLSMLCRRGQRRLRMLQASCQVSARLDRSRSVLLVCGSDAAIRDVRKQLESFGGKRRMVPAAVWAELMRTRTMHEGTQGLVAQLQQESGCRIHIERDRQEVRIFGPSEDVEVAESLLEELEEACTEQRVPVDDPSCLNIFVLHAMARAFNVILRMDSGFIVALGFHTAVAIATQELKRYIKEPSAYPALTISSSSSEPISVGAGQHCNQNTYSSQYFGTGICDNPTFTDAPYTTNPRTLAPAPGEGTPVQAAERSSNCVGLQSASSSSATSCSTRTCPTCGAGRYCVFCGAPTCRPLYQTGATCGADLPQNSIVQDARVCRSHGRLDTMATYSPFTVPVHTRTASFASSNHSTGSCDSAFDFAGDAVVQARWSV